MVKKVVTHPKGIWVTEDGQRVFKGEGETVEVNERQAERFADRLGDASTAPAAPAAPVVDDDDEDDDS